MTPVKVVVVSSIHFGSTNRSAANKKHKTTKQESSLETLVLEKKAKTTERVLIDLELI